MRSLNLSRPRLCSEYSNRLPDANCVLFENDRLSIDHNETNAEARNWEYNVINDWYTNGTSDYCYGGRGWKDGMFLQVESYCWVDVSSDGMLINALGKLNVSFYRCK